MANKVRFSTNALSLKGLKVDYSYPFVKVNWITESLYQRCGQIVERPQGEAGGVVK